LATKTPSKGKKPSPEKGIKTAPKKARAQKSPSELKEDGEEAPDLEDDDLDDDDLDEAPKPAAAAPAKKPAAPAGRPKSAAQGDDAPQVVPARRLTPEAKAKINELVAKGMPLGEALRAAASWETFVAPVREEPAKLVQGRSFDGGGGPRPAPREPREKEEREDDSDEESLGGGESSDDE
jgi:hypothetical protein